MKKKPVQLERIHSAERTRSLPGEFPRSIKITFLGAGSIFVSRLLVDVLLSGATHGEFVLVDIDKNRLAVIARLAEKLVRDYQRPGWKIRACTDRRAVLPGSHYVVNCIEVGGVACIDFDWDVPARFGVDQCIGDTIGPGGIFKGLRSVPVWLDVLRDCEELCPDAWVLNYSNPMSIFCLAAGRASGMRTVGLCHSVQGTSQLLAKRAGVPLAEMEWQCAGINHLAWFTTLKHQGRDLYPELKRQARAELAETPARAGRRDDLVRKDMMLHFGYFITESSGHLSEYVPYYRKRKDLLRRYCGKGFDGESRFLADNWRFWRENADKQRIAMQEGTAPLEREQSWEYGSWIIEAREKDVPYTIHGNVMNVRDGAGPLISNLSPGGVVEVACMVDRAGIHPVRYGALPPQCAAISEANLRVIDLAATAAMEKSKEAAIHALMLDPLTAAVCSPAEIRQIAEELFRLESKYLPGFK